MDNVGYILGLLAFRSHNIVFYNNNWFSDSSKSTNTNINQNFGNPDTTNSASITVYYKDANRNDILDILYNLTNNPKTQSNVTRKTYINNMLSTIETVGANGIKSYTAQWADGNVITDTEWNFNYGTLLFHPQLYLYLYCKWWF